MLQASQVLYGRVEGPKAQAGSPRELMASHTCSGWKEVQGGGDGERSPAQDPEVLSANLRLPP